MSEIEFETLDTYNRFRFDKHVDCVFHALGIKDIAVIVAQYSEWCSKIEDYREWIEWVFTRFTLRIWVNKPASFLYFSELTFVKYLDEKLYFTLNVTDKKFTGQTEVALVSATVLTPRSQICFRIKFKNLFYDHDFQFFTNNEHASVFAAFPPGGRDGFFSACTGGFIAELVWKFKRFNWFDSWLLWMDTPVSYWCSKIHAHNKRCHWMRWYHCEQFCEPLNCMLSHTRVFYGVLLAFHWRLNKKTFIWKFLVLNALYPVFH